MDVQVDTEAHDTLQHHYSDLRQSAFDPGDVGAELLARGVVSKNAEWRSRQSSVNPAERRTELVSEVMTAIKVGGPGVFDHFVQSLAKEASNKPICDKMIATYKSKREAKGLSAVVGTAGSQQQPPVAAAMSSQSIGRLGETVKLGDLTCFKYKDASGKTQRLYVIEDMAPKWKDIGSALKFTPSELQNIAMANHQDPAECCQAMMTKWIGGFVSENQPLTWATLLEAMEDCRLRQLAQQLESLLKQ